MLALVRKVPCSLARNAALDGGGGMAGGMRCRMAGGMSGWMSGRMVGGMVGGMAGGLVGGMAGGVAGGSICTDANETCVLSLLFPGVFAPCVVLVG